MNPRTYHNNGPNPKADVSKEELAARRAAHMALPRNKSPLSAKWPRAICRHKSVDARQPPKKTQVQLIDEAIARAKGEAK